MKRAVMAVTPVGAIGAVGADMRQAVAVVKAD